MKWLKRFNESVDTNNEFYELISQPEYLQLDKKSIDISDIIPKIESVPFIKKFIDSVGKSYDPTSPPEEIEVVRLINQENNLPGLGLRDFIKIKISNSIFNISELEDHYYLVSIYYVEKIHGAKYATSKYYKCDQIEGVIKLLEDYNESKEL